MRADPNSPVQAGAQADVKTAETRMDTGFEGGARFDHGPFALVVAVPNPDRKMQ
jgi:hypothetical protein